jgi:hypothetical protein
MPTAETDAIFKVVELDLACPKSVPPAADKLAADGRLVDRYIRHAGVYDAINACGSTLRLVYLH